MLQGNQILNVFAYICTHYCHCFRNDWQTEWGVRFNKQILLLILQWQWVGRRALFWLNQVRNPGLIFSAMRVQHRQDINARANIWSWDVYEALTWAVGNWVHKRWQHLQGWCGIRVPVQSLDQLPPKLLSDVQQRLIREPHGVQVLINLKEKHTGVLIRDVDN